MALSFRFTSNNKEWRAAVAKESQPAIKAAVAALREVAATSVREGRADIAAAGKFTGRWVTGLQYRIDGGEGSRAPSAVVFHKVGLAGVFESGATIQGRPLLWIPTTHGAPAPKKSGKKLVSATVKGTPLLFDADDRDRARRPLYIGVPQVRIPKRFHITEIVRKNVRKIADVFAIHFKES